MTCLRCGRTVPEQILLCPECRTPKKRLLDANSALTPEEQLQYQVSTLKKRTSRQKRRIVLLVVVCVLALTMLGFTSYTLWTQSARLASQNTLIKSQEAAIAEAQNTIAAYYRYTGLNPQEIPAPAVP